MGYAERANPYSYWNWKRGIGYYRKGKRFRYFKQGVFQSVRFRGISIWNLIKFLIGG